MQMMMSEPDVINESPEVSILLEIDPSLSRALDIADPLNQAIVRATSRRVAEVLSEMGIPGAPVVQIMPMKTNSAHSGQFLRVHVNGRLRRYPDELLRLLYDYVNGDFSDPGMPLSDILAWLGAVRNDHSEPDAASQSAAEFFSLACLNIIKKQPAVLLGSEQLAAYR